jgi:Cellulose binding domain
VITRCAGQPGQMAGRHRTTRRAVPQRRETLLLVDYPGAGIRPGQYPGGAVPTPGAPPRRRRWLAMAVSAALVGVTVIGAFGGTALMRITGGHGAAPDVAIPTPLPLPIVNPSIGMGAGTGAGRGTRPRRGEHRRGHRIAVPVSSRAPASPPAAPSSPPSSPPSAAEHDAALVVTYHADSHWDGGFQGQIEVANNGTQSIADWQIVVALPGDQIQSFWNASGYVSNGILLLSPPAGAQPLAPGGTLSVFFVAAGAETTPEACAFDGVACG